MEQLWAVLLNPSGFHYVPGKTPLSHWWQPVSVSVAYLLLVYLLGLVMRSRAGFSLKWVSVVHNFNLFVISVACFLGMVYGLYEKLSVRAKLLLRKFDIRYSFLHLFFICLWWHLLNFSDFVWLGLKRNAWSWETLFCDEHNTETNRGHLFYWIYLFYLSKIYELLDTIILVLKRVRTLSFLRLDLLSSSYSSFSICWCRNH